MRKKPTKIKIQGEKDNTTNPKESAISQHILSFGMDDHIYRILRFEHLIDMILENQMKFPRVSSWDDTYESFLFQSQLTIEGRKFGNIFQKFSQLTSFFGLCWSYWEETDALWRVYSPNNDRVKIKVKLEPLYNSIARVFYSKTESTVKPGFGRVVYVRKEDFDTVFSHELFMNMDLFMGYNHMFIKRMEFEYENEFRTILVDMEPNREEELLSVSIESNSLIEEVVFDPRIPDKLFDKYCNELDNVGFKHYRKSSLYDKVDLELKHSKETIQRFPLKVANYFDRTNALRMIPDHDFNELVEEMTNQIARHQKDYNK